MNDTNSQVSKLEAELRHFGLLAELNTRPGTTYLAEIRNPNPELEEKPLEGEVSRPSARAGTPGAPSKA